MSRYMDIKKLKLKDEDREIFVLRLAQVRTPYQVARLAMRRKK